MLELTYLACFALAMLTSSFHFLLQSTVSWRTTFRSSSPRQGSVTRLSLNSLRWVTFSWYTGASFITSYTNKKGVLWSYIFTSQLLKTIRFTIRNTRLLPERLFRRPVFRYQTNSLSCTILEKKD